MKPGRLRFWGWLIGIYMVLMIQIAGLVFFDATNGSGKTSLEAVGVAIGAFAILPIIAFALWVIWLVYPLAFWLFWQYLLVIEWITGIGLGRWFTDVLARDHYLRQSRKGSTSHWLFLKVAAHRRKIAQAETGNPTDA